MHAHTAWTLTMGIILLSSLWGCQSKTPTRQDPFATALTTNGKGDFLASVKIVDAIKLNSEITGRFAQSTRVYGYLFDARKGAVVSASVVARRGADTTLDTVLAIYGPYRGANAPGAQLGYNDDGETVASTVSGIEITETGKYLVVFSSWEDTEGADYAVKLGCEGTALQCMAPLVDAPCTQGTRYIQGGQELETQTWEHCEVVLLERTVVKADAILTVKPGVVVRGNYLGAGAFGDVALVVNGTLRAVGTAQHPISFSALDKGWKGIELNGRNNDLQHVIIEGAAVAVHVGAGGQFSISDAIISGVDEQGLGHRGIVAEADSEGVIKRSVVSGFTYGILLIDSAMTVEDSTVSRNGVGVSFWGPGDDHYGDNCPGFDVPKPALVTQFKSLVLRYSEITDNGAAGIHLRHPLRVIVEQSNLLRNGTYGILIGAWNLDPTSYIRGANIHDNKLGQLSSSHGVGMLDISGNFWNAISDPELSQSWTAPSIGQSCWVPFEAGQCAPYSGPLLVNGSHTAGPQRLCHDGEFHTICDLKTCAALNGLNPRVNVSGFSAEPFKAGPRDERLSEPVKMRRLELQKQH